MEKRKIWIVSELFHPEETAVAYIFTRIADHLSKDYDVSVICGPAFYDNEKKDFADAKELSKEITIYRNGSLNLNKNNLFQRTINIIVLSFKLANSFRKKASKGDIVLLATNPAPLLLLIGLLKKFKQFQLHILVHDVFPENTIPAGIFKNDKSILYKFIKIIFDKAYSQADHLIVLGRDMKDIIYKKVNRYHKYNLISIVPNWADTLQIMPGNRTMSLRQNLDLENKIVLQYAGNIGRVQGLEAIIEAFKISENKELHLLIHGSGALVPFIRNYIKTNQLSNVSLFGSYSRKDQNEILNSCDIAIVSLSSGMYGLGVPSKSYHILSAGKPILFLGDSRSEISCLVTEEGVGWSIEPNNQKELVDFFKNLKKDNLDQYINMGLKARLLVEEKYDEKIVLRNFQEKMESIILSN
jgi:glycosyltransferase involved in cell wall biosynthesis